MFNLDYYISYLIPYSELYGTGNPLVDLLIVCAVLSILSLLYLVKTALMNRREERGLVSRLIDPDRELEPLVELSKSLDQVSDHLEIQKQYTKQDLGYLSQELDDYRIDFKALKAILSPDLLKNRRRTGAVRNGRNKVPVFKKSA